MRGEHSWYVGFHEHPVGSSPHARGTPGIVRHEPVSCGIIPACAGNTECDCDGAPCIRDHPRMRGEHYNAVRSACSTQGSSPHARGTQRYRTASAKSAGIIPACAGNTIMRSARLAQRRDHPRMRGEHSVIGQQAQNQQGSSPHARGTL